jgi:hypothetical protein
LTRSGLWVPYSYLWVGGIHVDICLEERRLCPLVLIGVRAGEHKVIVAVIDGYWESVEIWADLLRDCARPYARARAHGRRRALGFWVRRAPGASSPPRARHRRAGGAGPAGGRNFCVEQV